mmetsp:Transcript_29114/g.64319  ORF Transcript_29114/g.64319 Transcript_29114/m.64319 type:complete len:89 (+) Transcript_29114:1041-1307(+)
MQDENMHGGTRPHHLMHITSDRTASTPRPTAMHPLELQDLHTTLHKRKAMHMHMLWGKTHPPPPNHDRTWNQVTPVDLHTTQSCSYAC